MIFENENARLLFEVVKHHYPNFALAPGEEELAEEKALAMYWASAKSRKIKINIA